MSEVCPPVEPETPDVTEAFEVVEGGDAACWANRVCQECGRLNEAERPVACEACGARFE